MEHTHACEDCGDEYFEPLFTTCPLCHGELLEQTAMELENIEPPDPHTYECEDV